MTLDPGNFWLSRSPSRSNSLSLSPFLCRSLSVFLSAFFFAPCTAGVRRLQRRSTAHRRQLDVPGSSAPSPTSFLPFLLVFLSVSLLCFPAFLSHAPLPICRYPELFKVNDRCARFLSRQPVDWLAPRPADHAGPRSSCSYRCSLGSTDTLSVLPCRRTRVGFSDTWSTFARHVSTRVSRREQTASDDERRPSID